ncbi:hypothetical protein ACS0PU_009857 [Formica fusca]
MSTRLTRRVKRSKTRHFCQRRAELEPSQHPRIMLNALTEPLARPPRRDDRTSRTNRDVEAKVKHKFAGEKREPSVVLLVAFRRYREYARIHNGVQRTRGKTHTL